MALQAYNAKVGSILKKDILGKDLWGTYYGVELEVEVDIRSKFVKNYASAYTVESERNRLFLPTSNEDRNTPIAHFVCDSMLPYVQDFCIIKRDGSLENGMEVVSLPMSLDLHRTKWDAFFENASKHGLRIYKSCGMHVHASRENLTSLQIGKVLAFLHDPANIEFIKIISDRYPPKKYANISNKCKIADYKRHNNRYDGFNLTNSVTVEFRIFKGTLDKERMLVNIEFCAALLGFSFPGAVSIRDNNLRGFINYVNNNRKLYPSLYSFLVAKSLISNIL